MFRSLEVMSQYAVERKELMVRRLLPPESALIVRPARESGISESALYLWRLKARAQGGDVRGKRQSGKAPEATRLAAVVETLSFNEAKLAEYCRRKGLYPEQVKRRRVQATVSGTVSVNGLREALPPV